MDKELPKINPAKLTKENYSVECGSSCPLCGFTPLNKDGCPVFIPSLSEQNLIGYSEPPWKAGTSFKKDCAAVFECPNCFQIYWYHFYLDFLKLAYNEKNSPDDR